MLSSFSGHFTKGSVPMRVLVLNGSPKGAYSITLQTIHYLAKLYPSHTFDILHVGQRIKALEKDFSVAIDALNKADLILFSYPVYTFIAPSQLHRFIELMKEHQVNVTGKYVSQITTSKHFYDVTAHRYIQDNCQDMHMKYIRGLSADMDDLLNSTGQQEAKNFWKYLCWSIKNDYYELPSTQPYHPNFMPITVPTDTPATSGDIVIITDCADENTQLATMIARFQAVLPFKSRVINLRKYPFKGGCLGCFHCATDGTCIYTDGFDSFLRNQIQNAQAMIYAFTISNHSMGSLFKMYDDRQFCNGHRTVTIGMPIGYLISGNYSRETNLQTILEARAQVGSNILSGIATDEFSPDSEIDKLAASLTYALTHKNTQPQNFYGIGGMKIFRDLIYQMQGMMKADHRFYKEHDQYDFPQKNKGLVLKMYLVGMLLSSPKIKSKIGNQMNEGMLAPYKKIIEHASKK